MNIRPNKVGVIDLVFPESPTVELSFIQKLGAHRPIPHEAVGRAIVEVDICFVQAQRTWVGSELGCVGEVRSQDQAIIAEVFLKQEPILRFEKVFASSFLRVNAKAEEMFVWAQYPEDRFDIRSDVGGVVVMRNPVDAASLGKIRLDTCGSGAIRAVETRDWLWVSVVAHRPSHDTTSAPALI